jgi:hypothetical protein
MKKVMTALMLLLAASVLMAEAPAFEVFQAPLDLGSSYYDYCPSSYVNTTVQRQNDEHGGTYILWHRKPTTDANRRIWNSYYDGTGTASAPALVDLADYETEPYEGYPGVDVDIETGIPFYAYHVNNDADPDYETGFGWDNFMFTGGLGISGINSAIGEAWDNTELIANSVYETSDFIWPYTFVMDHPTDENMVRIIVFGNNAAELGSLAQADNLLIATLDVDATAADFSSTPASDFNADWQYQTIPEMDDLAEAGHRCYITVPAVTRDGKICVFGDIAFAEGAVENQGTETLNLYTVYSDDFGETFTFSNFKFDNDIIGDENIPMPTDEIAGGFNSEGDHENFFWGLVATNHMNGVWGENGKVYISGQVALQSYELDALETSTYYPSQQYPKVFVVDPAAGSAYIEDVWPIGQDGLYKPWDRDEDGVFDTDFTDDEQEYYAIDNGWPHWNWFTDNIGADNYFRITKGIVSGDEVFAAVWTDGYNLKQYMDPENADADYQSWDQVPEICISISTDGINYEEPVRISAHETEGISALIRGDGSKMVPVYVTAADRIIDAGNNYGRIGLMFFDDLSFGSSIQSQGTDAGGNIRYMEIDVDFSAVGNSEAPVSTAALKVSNYPNPFNPETTISFDMPVAGNAKVAVYNVKGQLVKTLANENFTAGTNSVMWKGFDNNNNAVSSGVYFFKVETENESVTKRMVLMK